MGNWGPSQHDIEQAKLQKYEQTGYYRFTNSELKVLLLIHHDLSWNSEGNKHMNMSSFFKFFDVPGVIGMRLYKFFSQSNSKGITYEDFIWAMSRLWRPIDNELYESLFKIYNLGINCSSFRGNKGRRIKFSSDSAEPEFGVDELVTILRTYEKLNIYEILRNKLKKKQISCVRTHDWKWDKLDDAKEIVKIAKDQDFTWSNANCDNKSLKCYLKFGDWYYKDRPFVSSEDIRDLACQLFVKCGFLSDDKLNIDQFTEFMKQLPELSDPILSVMKQELWWENYTFESDTSEDDSKDAKPKSASASTYFSKQSLLDLSQIANEVREEELQNNLDLNIVSTSYSKYIVREPDSGPIGIFTSKHKLQHSGYLMKVRSHCGDFIKRYYFYKSNMLYYYGLANKKYVRRIPLGIIYVKDKLLEKFTLDGVYYIRFYNSFDRSIRIELAAESEKLRDEWFSILNRTCERIEEWVEFDDVIGTGQFATVRKATHKKTKQEYAVKIISKSDPDNYNRDWMISELRILSVINHPNIPKIYGVYENIDKMFIFMENIHHGSLFNHLRSHYNLAEPEAAGVAYEILDIVKYLHELKITHRDIKPENILVDKDESEKITKSYLIDYGLSSFYDGSERMTQMWGTLGYVAPEVLLNMGYTKDADVFSIGIVNEGKAKT